MTQHRVGAKTDDNGAQPLRENETDSVTIVLSYQVASELELATSEVAHLLNSAASVFAFLWDHGASGQLDNGCLGILEFCKRGLIAAAEREGAAIERLDRMLRDSLAITAALKRHEQIKAQGGQ